MKVKTVVLNLNPGVQSPGGFSSESFTDGPAYPDLHYIVRDGMAVINWSGPDGTRRGHSRPIHDIQHVSTVA